MGKKQEKRLEEPKSFQDAEFPDTRSYVLKAAVQGDWEPFLCDYLQPCLREVMITCRCHGLSPAEADDVFQELLCRVVQEARFNPGVRNMLAERNEDPDFRANLPGRYLKYRQLPLRAARFRTYLKNVIRNLLLEALRGKNRQPRQFDDRCQESPEPWVEQSVSRSLDRQWVADCLAEAAWQLHRESAAAPTRGRRRLFDILHAVVVENRSPATIANDYGLDRSTIAALLKEAGVRLLAKLQAATGISDPAELSELAASVPQELKAALARVHTDCATRPT